MSSGREAVGPHPSVGWLARFLVRLFYGKIEVAGLEQVPRDRPLVFVANHVNSLVDGALLLAYMPVLPRFLGTSELWKIPILKPFLRWAAAIPVYRRQVQGFDRRKNQHTFARCHEVLAAGGAVGILPEGTSHNEPALVPLRTGVSRIVLEAIERFGDLGIRIVPVGLTFEDRTRFRSNVLVEVGPPIDPTPEAEAYLEQPREAVRALTARVRENLVRLTLNFPSWDEADLIHRAAEIYQQPASTSDSPARPSSLHERADLRRTFIQAYEALQSTHPEPVGEVSESVRLYGAELRHFRLRDEWVAAQYSPREIARFTLNSLVLLLLRLPLGLLGLILHFLPFQLARFAARRLTQTADRAATHKVLASMVFYSLTWLALAVAAGWVWGWSAAGLALVLGPLTGGVALRFYLRGAFFWRRARAFFLLRSARPRIVDLKLQRRRASEAIGRLVDLYRTHALAD